MRQAESSDDEEHFRKKEQRRTERDTAKLRPLILSESWPYPWLARCNETCIGGADLHVRRLSTVYLTAYMLCVS